MKLKLLIAALVVMCTGTLQAQKAIELTADQILAKYFENTGGIEKWKAQKTRKIEGKMTMQGIEVTTVILEKSPTKQKSSFSIPGMEIVQAYDGKDAWTINPMAGSREPVLLPAEEAKDMTDKEFEDALIDYKKKGHEVTLLGTEPVDGTPCYKIKLVKNKNNPKDDVTELYYFDAENFVPILNVTVPDGGALKGQELKTYLSDYQDVNGMMMPFSMETKVNGETLQKFTFTKITIDEPMDDSLFAFPKK